MESIPVEIVEKIKSGDNSAFRQLYERYYTELCRFGLIYIKDRDAVENIVQDFFVNFWIKREEIKVNLSINSYLYSSIRNRALNYIRDNKKLINLDENLESIDSVISHPDFERDIDMNNLKKILEEAIEELPSKCKIIFRLSRNENLSYKEIAGKLDISRKTVENQIGIALKKIHEKLEPYMDILIFLLFFIFSGE